MKRKLPLLALRLGIGLSSSCLTFPILGQQAPAPTPAKTAPNFATALTGRFVLAGSGCAGFEFQGKGTVLWRNEIACQDPQTLKITWLDQRTFFTRSTERDQPNCPPKVDVYQVVSYDGRRLVLKSFWAGWNDRAPETETYVKQAR